MSLSCPVVKGKIRKIAKSTGQNRDSPLKRSKKSSELYLRITVLLRMIVMMLSIGKTTRMELMSQKAYNRKTTLLPKFLVPSNRMPNTGLISRVTGSTITWPLLLLSIKPGFSLILTTTLNALLLILKMLQTILLRRMHSSKTTLLRTFTSHNTMSTCSSIILQILRLNLFRSKIKW